MHSDLDFQFAVISDLHIALPHTIHDHPSRFHLVEWSISAFEKVCEHLGQLELDFLLIPGDLTQHGEPENHQWLSNRLKDLPFPTYVIPGNHDIPVPRADGISISPCEFTSFYRSFGYSNAVDHECYCHPLRPGVVLMGLNSNHFDDRGKQVGTLLPEQLEWLEARLSEHSDDLVLVMIHHNILEHFPNQTRHPIGHRYMLANAEPLRALLRQYGVQFVFTGHLHVQDIICQAGLVDVTTGSLVSYPHPYRTVHVHTNANGQAVAKVESFRVKELEECEDVQTFSREWMGDRSEAFMMRMLTRTPLNLPEAEAQYLAPHLKYFWATIAQGDPEFDRATLPKALQDYLSTYEQHHMVSCELKLTDNNTTIPLRLRSGVSV